jgi:hypothetical protein
MSSAMRSILIFIAVSTLSLFSTAVLADSPTSISKPDRHSAEVKGKINLFRVQVEGMNIGTDSEKADAEVFVTMDSNPGVVYTLQVRKDSQAANKVMARTLREAYLHKVPVTLYYQIATKRNNFFKLLMVQLN